MDGLDISAAISTVKKAKKVTKEKREAKAKTQRASTASFVASVAGQGAAATASVSRAAAAAKPTAAKAANKKKQELSIPQCQKAVFDHAKANRGALTFDEVAVATNVVIQGDLLSALHKHALLTVDTVAETITYRPELAVQSKADVAALLRARPFGVLSTDVADAYAAGRADAAALVAEGAAFEIGDADRGPPVLFPNTMPLPAEPPHEETLSAVLNVHLPGTELERDAALVMAGIPKAKRSTARLSMAVIQQDTKAPKKRAARRLQRVTNTHLRELFDEESAKRARID